MALAELTSEIREVFVIAGGHSHRSLVAMTLRFWLLGLVVVGAFAGCSKSVEPAKTARADVLQVIRIGNGTEPQDLDPQIISGRPESTITAALVEGLVIPDPQTLEPRPGQAERWTISPDGLVYTFYLRADARWSNGDPVTAEDFVRSARRILSPALAAQFAASYFPLVGAEDFNRGKIADFEQVGIKALDARRLQLTLISPVSYFLNQLIHVSWCPVHLPTVKKFDGEFRRGSAWTRPENYVGNGAFVLSSWRPNQIIVLQRSPTYWNRTAVKLNRVEFYPIENTDTEERMFRTGQLDVTRGLPVSKIDAYRKMKESPLRLDPFLTTAYVRVNVTRPALNDSRVRRALALAIDRESLCHNVLRGSKTPAYNLTPPGTAGFTPKPQFTLNVAAAKTLLAEAGFPGGEGLPPFSIMYPTSDNGQLIMEAVQEMWRRNLGVEVRLQNQEWKVFLDAMTMLDYDIAWSAWGGDYVEPMSFLETMTSTSGNNRTGWKNTVFDELIDTARRTTDKSARYALYEKMEDRLGQQAPILPLYFYLSTSLVRPTVKGWSPTPLDLHPLSAVWMDKAPTAR